MFVIFVVVQNKLDENKRIRIANAAIKLMVTIGFAETSMHKIAKEARISVSTIYLYYKNKEDMLNKVYLMLKKDFSVKLYDGFDPKMSIRDGILLLFNNSSNYFEEYPLKSSFMDQFENSALITKPIRDRATMHYQHAFEFIERGSKEGVLKDLPAINIIIFIVFPISAMIRIGHRHGIKMSKNQRDELFNMTWDAIKL